jgi:hypothetical protein
MERAAALLASLSTEPPAKTLHRLHHILTLHSLNRDEIINIAKDLEIKRSSDGDAKVKSQLIEEIITQQGVDVEDKIIKQLLDVFGWDYRHE